MGFGSPLVLAYHDIVRERPSRYAVTAEGFARDLESLLSAGWRPLPLEDALAPTAPGSGDVPAKSFTITFDDGLSSFAEHAMPCLERLGLVRAATVFVPTAFVGGENAWRGEPKLGERLRRSAFGPMRLLTWDELAGLGRAGVSLQSHGHRHLPMQRLSYDEALDDAATSRDLLGRHGIGARYLALPFGWRSEVCKRAIRDAGFDGALSVQWGGRDAYEVRRVPIYGTDNAALRRLKLSGRFLDAIDAAAALSGRRERAR